MIRFWFQGCKWFQKKKKGNPRQINEFENYATLTSVSYCLSLLQTLLIAGCIIFLAFYLSGWQCLLGAGRDLFLTTLAKVSRAVSESECTWLSIIISQMLWLLMHCLVFRYSRKFGLYAYCCNSLRFDKNNTKPIRRHLFFWYRMRENLHGCLSLSTTPI